MKPYPAYKDSGVPWLGQIPAHWDIGPGFSTFREKKVKNTGMVESTVLSLSYGKIVIKPPEKLHGLVPESFETYQIVDPTDIIIRPTDLQNDWNSLRVGLAQNRGIITSAYMCLRAVTPTIPEYGYLLLHAYDLMKIFYGMGSGLRQNLDFTDLKRMPVLTPPPDEQRAIARFLDAYDRLTRRYIHAQRRLIALLTEQKQALIQQAVTRGLDPDVPLKDSGIEWLGEIPAHWEIVALKHLGSKFGSGLTPRGGATVYQSSGIPLIRSQNVHFDGLHLDDVVFISDDIHASMSSSHIKPGDVLVNITGASIGRVCVVPPSLGEANVNQHVSIIRPENSKILSKFLATVISSPFVQNQIALRASGAAREGLPSSEMKELAITLPSIYIQRRILDHVEQMTSAIHTLVARTQRQIELVREYRTRLIADVVTGKLDVRGAALPDLPVDDADFDDAADLDDEDNFKNALNEEGSIEEVPDDES